MMTSRHALFLTVVLATQAAFSAVLTAAERPAAAAATIPNAAVIYWQAFAQLPAPLAEPQKAKYEAAVANPSAPVADDLKPIIASFKDSLAELHRAARVAACDWNLDYEAGAECRLPHLEKARALSTAALLRARLGFAAGKTDEAVADVVAVLKLARDCGSSPVLISLLVDAAIEKSATEVLEANLARLSPEQLDRLAQAIEALPATPSVADCMRQEGKNSGTGWPVLSMPKRQRSMARRLAARFWRPCSRGRLATRTKPSDASCPIFFQSPTCGSRCGSRAQTTSRPRQLRISLPPSVAAGGPTSRPESRKPDRPAVASRRCAPSPPCSFLPPRRSARR